MILIQSPTGNVLVNEKTGDLIDEQALRSLARQAALSAGQNPDAFEASMAASTGFDPIKMTTANGLDPEGFFATAALSGSGGPGPRAEDNPQQGSPRVVPNTPGGGAAPYATIGQPFGSGTEAPPPGGDALLPGGFTTPEQRSAELALLQAQIAKLTDPTAKATAEAQLQQILAQTANIGAGTGASAAVSRQNSLDQLAQQSRQFNETFGFNKAVNDQKAAADAADRQRLADQFASGQALSREQLDVQRRNTLLGLGSRPDTLVKYLYALRGQQTPQAIAGTTTNLPGFQNVVGQPNPPSLPFPAASGAAGASSPQPQPSAGAPNPLTMGTPEQNAYAQQNAANQTAANPSLAALLRTTPNAPAPGVDPFASTRPGGLSLPSLPGAAITPQPSVFNTAAGPVSRAAAQAPGTLSLNGGALPVGNYTAPFNLPPSTSQSPFVTTSFEKTREGDIVEHGREQMQAPDKAAGVAGDKFWQSYKAGGVIPEPVVGVGQKSGQPYEFGEEGPETVVPGEQTTEGAAEFAAAFFKALQDKGTDSAMPPMPGHGMMPPKPNGFANGGTIGYDPNRVPSLGSQSADLFNNPSLPGVVQRGYNSSPQTPLFPQIGLATGGGQSLVPSMQRLNSLLPSEQSLYAGTLQDEFGVQPNDVFSLSKSLAPQGTRTPPKFVN